MPTMTPTDNVICSQALKREDLSRWGLNRGLLMSVLLGSVVLNVALGFALQHARATHEPGPGIHGPDVGKTLAILPAKDMLGSPVAIDLSSSSPLTILYLYSPTCHWCAQNLENIRHLSRTIRNRGTARIIGISFDEQGLKEYVSRSEFGFPTYTSVSAQTRQEYSLFSTPTTLVVKNGEILKDWRGAYSGDLQHEVEEFFQLQLPGLTQK
jgi:hypothetical protein